MTLHTPRFPGDQPVEPDVPGPPPEPADTPPHLTASPCC